MDSDTPRPGLSPPAEASSLYFSAFSNVEARPDWGALTAAYRRARLLDAMAREVAAKGYLAVTVADVVARAAVSRRTFYEHFKDKEDCLLAAYDTGATAIIDHVAAAPRRAGTEGWRERLRISLEAYTAILAADPQVAKALMIDVLGAGERAIALRRRTFGRFVELHRALAAAAREEEPDLGEIPRPLLVALVGGIAELTQEHVVDEGAATLPQLAPLLTALATAVIEAGRGDRLGDLAL